MHTGHRFMHNGDRDYAIDLCTIEIKTVSLIYAHWPYIYTGDRDCHRFMHAGDKDCVIDLCILELKTVSDLSKLEIRTVS